MIITEPRHQSVKQPESITEHGILFPFTPRARVSSFFLAFLNLLSVRSRSVSSSCSSPWCTSNSSLICSVMWCCRLIEFESSSMRWSCSAKFESFVQCSKLNRKNHPPSINSRCTCKRVTGSAGAAKSWSGSSLYGANVGCDSNESRAFVCIESDCECTCGGNDTVDGCSWSRLCRADKDFNVEVRHNQRVGKLQTWVPSFVLPPITCCACDHTDFVKALKLLMSNPP